MMRPCSSLALDTCVTWQQKARDMAMVFFSPSTPRTAGVMELKTRSKRPSSPSEPTSSAWKSQALKETLPSPSSRARCAPSSVMRGEMSKPVTERAVLANSQAKRPGPQPMSAATLSGPSAPRLMRNAAASCARLPWSVCSAPPARSHSSARESQRAAVSCAEGGTLERALSMDSKRARAFSLPSTGMNSAIFIPPLFLRRPGAGRSCAARRGGPSPSPRPWGCRTRAPGYPA